RVLLVSTTDSNLFFVTTPATSEIYTLSLHDALPIWSRQRAQRCEADTSDSPTLGPYRKRGGSQERDFWDACLSSVREAVCCWDPCDYHSAGVEPLRTDRKACLGGCILDNEALSAHQLSARKCRRGCGRSVGAGKSCAGGVER